MTLASRVLVVALSCGASGLTLAADVHPDDFAYGLPINTHAVGTAYRLTLPVEVFIKAGNGDLRDVRVFNARGEVVPYELRQATPAPETRPEGPSLPLYPLHGDARASLNGLRVTIHSEGTAVDLQAPGSSPDGRGITSYVIDAREMAGPLSGLQVHWAANAPEFSGSVRIEASDDLGSWRLVKSDAAVIHLLTGGSELVQSRLEFPPTRTRFWRLTWIGKTAPFELTSVTAEAAADKPVSPQSSVTIEGTAFNNKDDELGFDPGARLPVTQVNLLLPQQNSVLKVQILSRQRATDPWRPVTQGDFYRVAGGASDHNNEPIRIPVDTDRFWLVRRAQPSGSIGGVKLQLAWDAIDVIFLAQGAGPFVLAFGNAAVGSSSVALEPLIKGVTVLPAEPGPSYVLGGRERLIPPARTLPWRMAALWSALGVGVLILAWMAYRLSKELGTRQTG